MKELVLTEELKVRMIMWVYIEPSSLCPDYSCSECAFNHTTLCPTTFGTIPMTSIGERIAYKMREYIADHPLDFPPEYITDTIAELYL